MALLKTFKAWLRKNQLTFSPSHYSTVSMSNEWTIKKIIPDVVDEVPLSKLDIIYPEVKVNEGTILKPTQAKFPPRVAWEVQSDGVYTVCMLDPDAPSHQIPSLREWHHWLVVNIPELNLSEGEVLSEYVGAGPPHGTGLHRYVFLVYKQKERINFEEPRLTNRSFEGRAKFSIRKFAEKYDLGKPIAGNFFQCEFDEYVPILYKQLGMKE